MENKVELIKATINDSKLLYEWATDKEVRKASFNTGDFSYESHCEWLEKQLNREDCDIFLCKINNNLVGQTRLYYENNQALINYSIASQYRGKGYAILMIKEVINYIFSNYPKIDTFVAEVKDNNLPSIKVFEKLEFSEKKVGTIYVFEKNR